MENDDIGFRMRGSGVTDSNIVVADDLLDYGDFVSSGKKKPSQQKAQSLPSKTSVAPAPGARNVPSRNSEQKPVQFHQIQKVSPTPQTGTGKQTVSSQDFVFNPETASGAIYSQSFHSVQTVTESFKKEAEPAEFLAEERQKEPQQAPKSQKVQSKKERKEAKKNAKQEAKQAKAQKKQDKIKAKQEKKKLERQNPAEAERNRVMAKAQKKQEKESLKEARKEAKKNAQEERERERQLRSNEVKIPIGGKLIAIISLLFIIALGGLTYLVSIFVSSDVRNSAEENNLSATTRTASDAQNRIESTMSSVGLFLDLLKTSSENESELRSVENMFFLRNKDIGAVYLLGTDRLYISSTFFLSREADSDLVLPYFQQESKAIAEAALGTIGLENATPYFSIPTIAIFFPLNSVGDDTSVAVIYSSEAMSEAFSSSSINQTFFVNNNGSVLVHSDAQLMADGADESNNPVVLAMFESSSNTASQMTFIEDGEEYIGAFKRLGIGNGGIVTTVKTSVILEGVNRTTRRNLYISMVILAIAILAVYFFAKSLSIPLKKLSSVVNEINQGNFNTELFGELGKGSKDEVGVLIRSTHNEREILNTVTQLTNKGVTKAIIKKEIDFEPHLKDITIFFSDIRGFTEISDGFKKRFGEKSAAEIIGFLNDYMSRMVTCITRTGGIVDKFEGDAIMACWGVLRQESLDWEQKDENSATRAQEKEAHDRYVKQDALSGVICSIAMRYSLMKYNKDAEAFTEAHKNEPLAQYRPHIRIGSGLNSGRATVGFMGSFDKMEFTSIGDAVNFASRTEASNKPCGTDILISEDTYSLLKKDYIKCEENNFTILPENKKNEIVVEQIPVSFEVKGKGKQHFYGVVNMPGFDIQEFFGEDDPKFRIDMDCARSVGPIGPKTLSEVRELLGIPEPDFGKVNLDAEEDKIQVATT